jgi:4-amino-4-deoxy-L-arabinose transferase-like glycosyltransferase
MLTGSMELGGRLVAALAGLLAVLVTFDLGRRLGGNLTGLLAGMVLATSVEFFFLARWYRMDMPFAAFQWAAIAWFARYEVAGARAGRFKRWLPFYAFCGLAFLMKGPAGLALPLGVVGVYLALTGQWRRVFDPVHAPGLLLCGLVAMPYFLVATHFEKDYLRQFFLVQNVERFSETTMGGHTLYGVGYVGVLLGGLLPWSIYLPGAIVRSFPRRWSQRAANPLVLLLWLAAGLIFLFFCLSRTQMPNYILPVFPPLAVLLAWQMALWAGGGREDATYRIGAVGLKITLLALVLLLAAAEVAMPQILKTPHAKPSWHGWLDLWILVPILATLGWAVLTPMKKALVARRQYLLGAGAVATVILLFATFHTMPKEYSNLSLSKLGAAVQRNFPSDGRVVALDHSQFSVTLYSGRLECEEYDRSSPNALQALAKRLAASEKVCCLAQESSLPRLEDICGRKLPRLAGAEQKGFLVVLSNGAAGLPASRPATTRGE